LRAILALALIAASIAAGCAVTSSSEAPAVPAPTISPGERPTHVIPVDVAPGAVPVTLRVYDRSLAIEAIRGASRAELAGAGPLDPNEVGAAQTVTGEIVITWSGSACGGGTSELFVAPGVTGIVVVPGATASCAAGEMVRGVVLAFSPPVDFGRVGFSIARGGSAG
jgi:hypothetical protein